MATAVTIEKMSEMIRNLDQEWKKNLVIELFNSWKDRALIETTSQSMLRFTRKEGGKWFAILFPGKGGRLKMTVSDYRETIHVEGLPLVRAPGDQFEKCQYGTREVIVEREDQCDAVRKAFQLAYNIKCATPR